jgi:hypothetical protein
MGSSPGKSDMTGAPAPQGPPPAQLAPPQQPPVYPEFIQGAGVQQGLTPDMLAAIAANAAPPPPIEPPPAAAAPANRNTLAELLAMLVNEQGSNRGQRWAEGGGMGGGGLGSGNRGGYGSSGLGGGGMRGGGIY